MTVLRDIVVIGGLVVGATLGIAVCCLITVLLVRELRELWRSNRH